MVCDGAEQNTNAITDSGTVTAGGSYASNTDCRWRLTCSDENLVPKLTFTSFETEDNDFVKIYDGSGVTSDTLPPCLPVSLPSFLFGLNLVLLYRRIQQHWCWLLPRSRRREPSCKRPCSMRASGRERLCGCMHRPRELCRIRVYRHRLHRQMFPLWTNTSRWANGL
jgi:hypothetical protein